MKIMSLITKLDFLFSCFSVGCAIVQQSLLAAYIQGRIGKGIINTGGEIRRLWEVAYFLPFLEPQYLGSSAADNLLIGM